MLNSKNRVFKPIFFNRYLSNEKAASVDKSRIEPTIFFIEHISFSLKLFSGHFYGQSFIKTVRGPLNYHLRVISSFKRFNHICVFSLNLEVSSIN